MEVSAKAFRKDTPEPTLQPAKLRLYSMRFCPYAQRTRLVLAHKGIIYETVNINLRDKPDWFLKKNPLGKVPVLEVDGKIVSDSSIGCDYLDEVYDENCLTPKDPYAKAKQRMLVEMYGTKVIPNFYAVWSAWASKDKADKLQEAKQKLTEGLKMLEDSLEGDYFGGEAVGMSDFLVWPWLEALKNNKIGDHDFFAELPKLASYAERMLQLRAVKETMTDTKALHEFHKTFADGMPNYDAGL